MPGRAASAPTRWPLARGFRHPKNAVCPHRSAEALKSLKRAAGDRAPAKSPYTGYGNPGVCAHILADVSAVPSESLRTTGPAAIPRVISVNGERTGPGEASLH